MSHSLSLWERVGVRGLSVFKTKHPSVFYEHRQIHYFQRGQPVNGYNFPVVVLFVLFFAVPASGQIGIDRHETKNFTIKIERSSEQPRPTAKEVGVLVEKLCSQLDKIFVKYSPYHLAQTGEESARKADPQTDPNRVIPRCNIFIFNTRTAYEAKCREDGIDPHDEGYAGFFTSKTNSIYMIRSGSLQSTREIILHETTHFYTHNFLPGGWYCYPQWFHEGLAETYEKHTWNGDNLVIGFPPRLSPFDQPGSALKGLVRLRTYTQSQGPVAVPEPEGKGKPVKKTTPVQPDLIQSFLDTQFTPELLRRDGVELTQPNEEIRHRYAMYQALGRFLVAVRPDVLGAILRRISQWENEKAKEPPKKDRFIAAWKKIAEDKPISIEDIGAWVQKNQLTFKWVYKDWQDMGDMIAGIADEGRISILLLRDPKTLPKFTVFPKNMTKFRVGVVVNFIDNDNYRVVSVAENGTVMQREIRNGVTLPGKAFDNMVPVPGKYGPSFQFAAVQQGGVLRISINKVPVGDYPRLPNTFCGFFIGSTEAVFVP